MARTLEQIASRNAAAKKSYHMNHHANLKRRFMQRVASGKTTRIGKASLDKFGMTMEEVNDIRRCDGLGDLRSPLEPPSPCRLLAGDNGGNAARASDPDTRVCKRKMPLMSPLNTYSKGSRTPSASNS